jgi:hypothetical protein
MSQSEPAQYHGIIPPILTPLEPGGQVDLRSLFPLRAGCYYSRGSARHLGLRHDRRVRERRRHKAPFSVVSPRGGWRTKAARTLSFAKTASVSPGERPCWSDRLERLETGTRQRLSALCYAKISSDSRRNVRHRSS